MTGMDVARLSCEMDGNMFKTNAQIVWEQMMKGLKTHSQNFTVAQILSRLGRPSSSESYSYVSKYNLNDPTTGVPSADALINAVAQATNTSLKTTNIETLKNIQAQVARSSSLREDPLYKGGVNDLSTLIKAADAYNVQELTAVNGTPSTLGWNAANQTESTVLYMNKVANKNVANQNIASGLLSLNSGDKIMITDVQQKTRQMWLVNDVPKPNPNYPNVINVPVTYSVRPFNVASVLKDNIANDANLSVTLERFAPDELD